MMSDEWLTPLLPEEPDIASGVSDGVRTRDL